MKKRTLVSWSSGKDSAWTLHILQQDPEIELVGLYTIINSRHQRALMHATRLELLQRQADEAGMQLNIIEIPDHCSNKKNDAIMAEFIANCETEGIEQIAFGDLFLEDIRKYRERQLSNTKIKPLFPLWKIPTGKLAHQMLKAGIKAYISSVDLSKLPTDFAGQQWSKELIDQIPAECDPCGENGELHTIVVGGPMFDHTIPVHVGKIFEQNGFAYADIIPE